MLVNECADRHSAGHSKELFNEVASNLKFITDEEWSSNHDKYKRVWLSVYVRTDVGNLVLMIDKDRISEVTDVPACMNKVGLYPTFLYDTGLMCGKIAIDSAFSFKSDEAMKRLVCNSVCFPVDVFDSPMSRTVIFNVVISKDVLEDDEIALKDGFRFVPIQSLEVEGAMQKHIAETLVIVGSEGEQ